MIVALGEDKIINMRLKVNPGSHDSLETGYRVELRQSQRT